MDRIVAVHILATDDAQTSIQTREKGMRSNDTSFAALLLIEGLTETAIRGAIERLRSHTPAFVASSEHAPLYASVFGLRHA